MKSEKLKVISCGVATQPCFIASHCFARLAGTREGCPYTAGPGVGIDFDAKSRLSFCRVRGRRACGWMMAELVVACVLIGILLGLLAVTMYTAGQFEGYQVVRQQCVAAGMSELDSYTARGEGLASDVKERLWPTVRMDTQITDGTGDWEGLKLVTVRAEGMWRKKSVGVTVCRYVSGEQEDVVAIKGGSDE